MKQKIILNGRDAIMTEDYFGTWSKRLLIEFRDEHPQLGKDIMTKYYNIEKNNIFIRGLGKFKFSYSR